MNADTIIELLSIEKSLYQELLNSFKSDTAYMPEGSLICRQVNTYLRFYHYIKEGEEKKQRYLSKKDSSLKVALYKKRIAQQIIPQLNSCIKAIDEFLVSFKPYDPSHLFSAFPVPVRELCLNYGKAQYSDFDWSKASYEKNEMYSEGLIYWTAGGLKVRSKSEAIIAGLLEKDKIPFRYEASLKIGDKTYYPDFTILRPRDKRIFYWEHFGMMDDEDYKQSANRKMAVYLENDFFPWDQLITTYESDKCPIDVRNIQSIINAFFIRNDNPATIIDQA